MRIIKVRVINQSEGNQSEGHQSEGVTHARERMAVEISTLRWAWAVCCMLYARNSSPSSSRVGARSPSISAELVVVSPCVVSPCVVSPCVVSRRFVWASCGAQGAQGAEGCVCVWGLRRWISRVCLDKKPITGSGLEGSCLPPSLRGVGEEECFGFGEARCGCAHLPLVEGGDHLVKLVGEALNPLLL